MPIAFGRRLLVSFLALSALTAWPGDAAYSPASSTGEGAPHEPGGILVPAPGHSLHGEAFNEGPRRAAILMPGMPAVHFAVTTTNEAAQAFFDQGVGQLHGFWYFEAERSFRQVAALDARCGMAFWGMAMANVNNAQRARDFIARAVALKTNVSPREQRWIEALAEFHRTKDGEQDRPETARRREYVRALESLVQDFPDDVEAKAFLALQIWDNAGFGNEKALAISSHQAVDTLLDSLFALAPMHPAHHYRIHLWDGEKPTRALGSAARGGPAGPGIAHLWHMPGHTYDKLQRYADAAWQQEASARVDHAYMYRAHVLPDQIHNYAHNQEWLIRSFNHLGRVSDALGLARNLTELPRHPKWNDLSKGNSSSSYGRWRLAGTLLRWELWDELAAEADVGHLEPTDNREHATLRHFSLGLASLMRGETGRVEEEIGALQALRAEIGRDRIQAADDAEVRSKKENKNRDEVSRAMVEALQGFDRNLLPVDDALAELHGWQAALRQDREQARGYFNQARDIPKTRLAYAWLRAGDLAQAEKIAREAAAQSTNQLHELVVRCDILWQVGKTNDAQEAFGAVRSAASFADLNLPPLRRLRPVADSLGLPADWRLPYETPADLGERPPLDSLGPRLWQPYEVPAWSFVDAEGRAVRSDEYAGLPYLLLFYLGHGCPHCIEQLKAFTPAAADFGAIGVPLVAVSRDAPSELPATVRRVSTGGSVPFAVVSDAGYAGFKAFSAYDDFEKLPLHGAFLVDARGRVRWQDISHEPFTNVKFLLAETRRLLKPTATLAAASPAATP